MCHLYRCCSVPIPQFVLSDVWAWLTVTIPAPSAAVMVASVLAGCALAANSRVWFATRLLATWVHETGHATVALLTGRQVHGIRLEADTSGTTEHAGSKHGLSRILTAAAGYPAPAVSGALLVVAVASGHVRWAVAGMLVVVVLMLPLQRSWRGLVVTVIVAAAGWLLVQASPELAVVAVTALAGYLLIASPRTLWDLHRARRHPSVVLAGQHSDADTLAGLTGIPAVGWEVIFAAGCGVAVWVAVRALLTG